MELETLPAEPPTPEPPEDGGRQLLRRQLPAVLGLVAGRTCRRFEHALDTQAGRAETPLGLYLHIPFCRKRCKFCYFRVYTDKNAGEIETYLSALSREIDLYADRDGLRGPAVRVRLLRRRHAVLSVQRAAQAARSSGSTTAGAGTRPRKSRSSASRARSRNRSSRRSRRSASRGCRLGVEHFDDEILSINGRAHKSPEIDRAYEWARDVGFPQINIDLIAGMLGETEDKWKYAVEKAIALDPDSVTIYQMEVPFNTGIAKDAREHGGVSAGRELGAEAGVGRLRVQAVRGSTATSSPAPTRW